MDVSECVLSAGRAVLDMVEQEWQPLSAGELEQRLDQAMEELLEDELIVKAKSQSPPTIYVQLLQSQANANHAVPHSSTHEEESDEPRAPQQPAESAAVKHIADLLQSSESRARMAGRARLSLSNTVRLALILLTEHVSYRSMSHRFHLEKGNIHRMFFSFCKRINALEETLIRWPIGTEAVETLVPLCGAEMVREEQGIPRVLGVLGHTCIPVRLPAGKRDVESTMPEVKRMKKESSPSSWMNLQLVCDSKGRFLHCSISKGPDTDRGLSLSDKLKRHLELMPPGSCLVGRAGYPLSARILTPYSGSHGPKEELFNNTLEKHFHILDQTVANLRARFQRLRYLDIGNYDRARAVVLTACVLHNVFLDMGQAIQGEVEKEEAIGGMEEREEDNEGVQGRDAISDLLFKYIHPGNR